jgi:flavin-dependent dehydrogenase
MDSNEPIRQAADQWFEGARLQARRKSFDRNGGAESPAHSKLFRSVETFREVDVLVVGAGPAGATAALNLAPSRTVVLVDRDSYPRPRIGESLPPAARRLFCDMGIWESFQSQGHSPCYGNRAVWGSPEPFDTDFLRDPDGHGWHIDRARFDRWVRELAVDRGATLLAPSRPKSIAWDGQCWRAKVTIADGLVEIIARVLIDAGGRASPVSRSLGARRELGDKLVCSWVSGKAQPSRRGAGFTYVEATEDGWWYSAPLPEDRRVLAFHTDSDLPVARSVADPKRLLESALANRELGAVLSGSGFTPEQSGFAAAHSAILQPFAGPAWFAAGDAAFSFDPLSSQGLLNALFTGLAAAEAADRHLSGADDSLHEYSMMLNQVYSSYQRHLMHWYGAETRWNDQPFWQRRGSGSLAIPAN